MPRSLGPLRLWAAEVAAQHPTRQLSHPTAVHRGASPSSHPTPAHPWERPKHPCSIEQGRGGTGSPRPRPPMPRESRPLLFLHLAMCWLCLLPGKLSRTCCLCRYGYEEGGQFPVRYLLIAPAGCWGRLGELRGDGSPFCGDPTILILTSHTDCCLLTPWGRQDGAH